MTTQFKLPLLALASALSLAATGASAQTTTTTAPTTTPAPADPATTPADPSAAPMDQTAPAATATPAAKPAKETREERKARKAAEKAAKTNGTTAPATPADPASGTPATPAAAASPNATPNAPAAGAPAAGPAAPASTAPNPDVGGAKMDATKTIVANASAAPNLSTLVKAVTAAGLVPTLSGPGPFTVFAPTNDAFGRLAPGTIDTLLKPENKALLVKALTYHVVPGNISATQLLAQIDAGGGKATLTTVEGSPLTVTKEAQAVVLTDVNGNKSYIQTPDVRQSNGVVHVVNGVVLPKLN